MGKKQIEDKIKKLEERRRVFFCDNLPLGFSLKNISVLFGVSGFTKGSERMVLLPYGNKNKDSEG